MSEYMRASVAYRNAQGLSASTHDGEPRDRPSAEPTAGEPHQRQRGDGEHARERAHGRGRVSPNTDIQPCRRK